MTQKLISDYSGRWRGSAWLAALCPCGHARDSPGAHFVWNPSIGCGVCHGKHGTLRLTNLCAVLNLNPQHHNGIYLPERMLHHA